VGTGFIRRFQPGSRAAWFVYVVAALACTAYLNSRAELVTKWGDWYAVDEQPVVLMQVRAFLSGQLALVPHPSGLAHDSVWGRLGMHTNFGLGLPILATPFHLLGRLFGAPGFPDHVRFLILYATTTVLLARALHRASRRESDAVASAAAAGFLMVFPAFVGLVTARFRIYEQTIATGALWSVLLLCGILAVAERCTPGRLVAVCAAAGFSTMIRAPLAAYGLTTAALAIVIAHRARMKPSVLLAGFLAYVGVTTLYLAGNELRFGSPFEAGYANIISVPDVDQLTRWGLSFAKVPFAVAAKELFVTLFMLDPIPSEDRSFSIPPSLLPYVVGRRFREYYSPTYDLLVFAIWMTALALVCVRVVRRRLWRRDRELGGDIVTVVGLWALPPSIALSMFYVPIGNLVTRYLVDLYPAFAASALCVGMAFVQSVRERVPRATGSVQLAIAGGVALYIAGWRGWVAHTTRPVDRATVVSRLAEVYANSAEMPHVPDHFACKEPRGRSPVYTHLAQWHENCSFGSPMVFAMQHSPCISFELAPSSGQWTPAENESLAGFRATADFDHMKICGSPAVVGNTRRVTMCDPHPPAFLLDGLRLYAIASLDLNLDPLDRLLLLRIDAAPACP
jgi:hypothetical protein